METLFAREVNADVMDPVLAEILAGDEALPLDELVLDEMVRPMRLPTARQPGRVVGCAMSLLVFGAAMAGVAYFCAQGWEASGSFDVWVVQGPFAVFNLRWEELLENVGTVLACGAVACVAFLAGAARTGLIAERRHPLIPSPYKRRRGRKTTYR